MNKMKHLKKFNESNLTKLPYEKWVDKYFDWIGITIIVHLTMKEQILDLLHLT